MGYGGGVCRDAAGVRNGFVDGASDEGVPLVTFRGKERGSCGDVESAGPNQGGGRNSVSHVRGLLKGPKFNGRHSTVIDSAIPVIEAARDCPYVSKISLGVITPIGKGKSHLKFTETNGGLRMQVRGDNG